ncbi:homeobox-leucine zipper protein ATHB-7-like [Dorcoceras hygrometricum]|uniref:Homeobox-leucine zipper protein n=1 Tax=Dorcoceras hygrometricum TaxID=472368 RepID=A0A2Z7CME4_9LAMI|nr:homeobox-leucine zipper protein ATHB-7-like [Dorcoceras hygrometricum]
MSTIKRSKNNRRRFSDEQIRSLETMFDAESRPELRLKMNLANKLGLQPRQVAIWFQNKRARSKSKHIETEYGVLKTKFDELSSQFDILRKENQALLIQLQRLKSMAGQKDDEIPDDYEDRIKIASESPEAQREAHSNELFMPSCGDAGKRVDSMETEFLNMAQDSLTSPDTGCSFDSCTFLDNPGYSSQWWDFKFCPPA